MLLRWAVVVSLGWSLWTANLAAQESSASSDDTVTTIEIIGTRNDREEELVRALLGITQGEAINSDKVRQSLKRVMARGYYRNVEIFKRPSASGTGLVLQVRLSPSAYLEEIRFQGLVSAEERLIRNRLNIRPGDPVSEKTLASVNIQVANILEELGYADAEIKAYWDQTERVGRTLLLGVKKGHRSVITHIDFEGELPEPRAKLASYIKLKSGAALVQSNLNQAKEELENRIWAQGFLAAQVTYDVKNIASATRGEKTVNDETQVTYRIRKGPKYLLLYMGQHAFTAGYLKQNVVALSDVKGVSERHLKEITTKIEDFYREQGFWQARAQLRDVPAMGHWRDRAERLLVVQLQEGTQVQIADVKIRGAVAKKHQDLTASVWQVFEETNEGERLAEQFRPSQFAGAISGPSGKVDEGEDSFLVTQGPVLTPKGLRAARMFLEKLYRQEGYVFIRVGSPDVRPMGNESRAQVIFHLQEGPQMRVGTISVRPPPPFAIDTFLQKTKMIPGQPLDGFAVEDSRLRLLRIYEENGYPWVKVAERLEIIETEKLMDVYFDVSPGPMVRVGDLQIQGHKVTQKNVILEQLVMAPGQPLKRSQIETSRMNLLRLGVFSAVEITVDDIERAPEVRDVFVTVTERPQVTLEAGLGASLEDGPRTFTNFTYRNIAGRGLALKGRLQLNYPAVFYPMGFLYDPDRVDTLLQRFETTELDNPLALSEGQAIFALNYPRIPNWPFDAGAHVDWNTLRDIRWAFTMNKTAILTGLQLRPLQGLHLRPQVELEATYFDCAVEGRQLGQSCGEESIGLTQKQEAGTIGLGTLRLLTLFDRRNDPLKPSQGFLLSAGAELTSGSGLLDSGLAGPGGISAEAVPVKSFYSKVTSTASVFLPLAPGVTLAQNFKGGVIHGFAEDGYVPLYKRFFLGGTKTIRGYNEDQILPVDDVHWPASEKYPLNDQEQANTKISLGGQVFWVSRTEFRFPLLPALEGGMFLDMGALALDPDQLSGAFTAAGMGVGVRIQTPIGPFVVDLATPLLDGRRRIAFEPTDRLRLHFAIGYF